MADAILEVFRGDQEAGEKALQSPGRAGHGGARRAALHPGHQAPDLAVRWNCKAGKCGSCSAEVNGRLASLVRRAWIPFPRTSPSPSSR